MKCPSTSVPRAISHRVYFSLLIFVPAVGLLIPFILGAKGNEYAWRARSWRSAEEYLGTQLKWTITGIVLGVLLSLCCMAALALAHYNME